jgi:hypothetical protein
MYKESLRKEATSSGRRGLICMSTKEGETKNKSYNFQNFRAWAQDDQASGHAQKHGCTAVHRPETCHKQV